MNKRRIARVLLFTIAALSGSTLAQEPSAPSVQDATLGKTRRVHACGELFLAGQPTQEDIRTIKQKGIKRVITLRTEGEIDWDEEAAVKGAGLEFVQVPFRSPDSLTDGIFDQVRRLLKDADDTSTLLHCGSANRVGAVWLVHRVLDQGVSLETAVKEAKAIGLRTPEYEAKARHYIARHLGQQAEANVRPGINANFLSADLDIQEWLGRFEVESREVFAARHEVLKATQVGAGMRVADIGAGTGFFTRLFSEAVGTDGWVFAVDIAPRFVEHINEQAHESGLSNVTTVLCTRDSIGLPPQSVDVAFVCDTYHHFEYPKSTLASIHRALRPGGTLVVIDFERTPGTSREFILDHVRAGKEVFRAEIESSGFELINEVQIDALKENYFLRLKKQP